MLRESSAQSSQSQDVSTQVDSTLPLDIYSMLSLELRSWKHKANSIQLEQTGHRAREEGQGGVVVIALEQLHGIPVIAHIRSITAMEAGSEESPSRRM